MTALRFRVSLVRHFLETRRTGLCVLYITLVGPDPLS